MNARMFDNIEREMNNKRGKSFNELKNSLLISNNSDLIEWLLEYINCKINKFNYNTKYNKNRKIKRAIEYLDYSGLDISDDCQRLIYDSLKEYCQNICTLIETPSFITNMSFAIENQKILLSLKNVILRICKKYEKENRELNNSEIELYNYIIKCIEEKRSLTYIAELLKIYPNAVNIKGKNMTLIEEICHMFANSFVTEKKHFNKFYLEKVMELFLTSPHFEIDIMKIQSIIFSIIDDNYLDDIRKNKNKSEILIYRDLLSIIKKTKKTQVKDLMFYQTVRNKSNLKIYEYSKEENNEIYMLPKLTDSLYKDHTNKNIFTIDSYGASRFEDGLCYEIEKNYNKIYMYVADVGSFIPENFYIDKRAIDSAMQFFLPDKTLTKVGLLLKNGMCAYTLCHELTITKEGEIVNMDIYRAKVKVKNNYKFGGPTENIDNNILEIYDIVKTIKENQNQFKQQKNILPYINNEVVKMISLEIQKKYNLPFIYRSAKSEGTDWELPNYYQSKLYKKSKNEYREKVKYTTDKDSCIIQFSSPCRSYDALFNQRLILKSINNKPVEVNIENIVERLNHKNIKIEAYIAEKRLYKRKKHLKQLTSD